MLKAVEKIGQGMTRELECHVKDYKILWGLLQQR